MTDRPLGSVAGLVRILPDSIEIDGQRVPWAITDWSCSPPEITVHDFVQVTITILTERFEIADGGDVT